VVLLRSTLIAYFALWSRAGAGRSKPSCDRLEAVGLPEHGAEAVPEDGRFWESRFDHGIVRFGELVWLIK
jgi:hypothetical protein